MIKYQGDARYSVEDASTHDRTTIDAVGALRLDDVARERVQQADVIGVDEGQFFPDLVPFCENMANAGKIVVISALSGSFERKAIGHVLELIPLAEKVDMLNAVCKFCLRDAAFSARLGSETAVQVIGGADKYASACRECFPKHNYHSPAHKKRPALLQEGAVPKRLAFTTEKAAADERLEAEVSRGNEAALPEESPAHKKAVVVLTLETPVVKASKLADAKLEGAAPALLPA